MDRRDFLKLLGVATGASVASGCNLERQSEKLIPYLVPPDDGTIPGEATYGPSVCTECPAACAVTARIREGRPVRVDGTAGHPVNDGGLCLRGQASINRLYHNERLTQPMLRDADGALRPATWDEALRRVTEAWGRGGRRVFLSGHTTGSLSALIDETCEALAIERRPEFEFYGYAALRRANAEVFGIGDVPALRLKGCDVLVTIGADVIETFDNPVDASRQIAARRASGGFRWFHVEPHATMTGLKADDRLIVRPGSEAVLLAWLVHEQASRRVIADAALERLTRSITPVSVEDAAAATGVERARLEDLAESLLGARRPALLAGGVSTTGDAGRTVARLAAVLQAAAGMVGRTLDFTSAQDRSRLGDLDDMEALRDDLASDRVAFAMFFRTDPVGTLDDGGAFALALERARFSVAVTDLLNATAAQCHVVLPASHVLESWADAEPRRGVVNAARPAFAPMHDTRSDGDILLALRDACGAPAPVADYAEYLQARWERVYGAGAARRLVERGWATVRAPRRAPSVRSDAPAIRVDASSPPAGTTLVVAPSVRWFDGRSRQLPLLNEVPDPLTTVSWGAWVSLAPRTARRLGVGDRDMVRLRVGDGSEELPVRLLPALSDGVAMVHKGAAPLALGRAGGEAVAAVPVRIERTGSRAPLPYLAGALGEAGRGAVPGHEPRHFGAAAPGAGGGEGSAEPGGGHGEAMRHEDVSFYDPPEKLYPKIRWAMAVDLDRCVGCAACIASCYVENNVPMVGPDEHLKGREMAWIRLEPYYESDEDGRLVEAGADADFVPAMCQHCDYAPCETVCPVFATMHNDEGLNVQVYNRCVGTRYCANNCPFKQRRFNWFSWNHRPDSQNLMHPLMVNPDVSLRGKGIMEKCSFCVQRIRKARDVAKDEGRPIRDGEVVPACAQACPADAIVFGNLRDETARVTQLARSERAHRLLDELGVGPAVFYLSSKGSHDDV